MMHYGFQRLVLLGSAGYQRAELPLDDSVSLIAPNNTGKTSLINALQYLLIIDRRYMDFGAHDFDKSRRFYFPNNSAYILLEISLPNAGTVVLGCVGRGVSHDYDYFAYQGQLEVEDFRTESGALVTQPELQAHLGSQGKVLFSYTGTEFAELIYGGRKKRSSHEPDFTVFRLEHSSDAPAFRRVLTRTLKLDKLKSAEVKTHLLQIFKRDLPDASINFKEEWEKAFSEVNREREQYEAAVRLKPQIAGLETLQDERLILRGRILRMKPEVEQHLSDWQQHYETRLKEIDEVLNERRQQRNTLSQRDRELAGEQKTLEHCIDELHRQQQRQDTLQQQFALISTRDQLERQLQQAQTTLETQITLVKQISGRSVAAIERELADAVKQHSQLQRQLETLHDNLWQQLSAHLPVETLEKANRVFSQQVMSLSTDQFEFQAARLKELLETGDPDKFNIPGLELNLEGLTSQYQAQSEETLREHLSEVGSRQTELQQQLEAARSLEAAQKRKAQCQQEVDELKQSLVEFDELQNLMDEASDRNEKLSIATARRDEIETILDESQAEAARLDRQLDDLRTSRSDLEQQHRSIDRLRNQRIDQQEPFLSLAALPHTPWVGDISISIDELATALSRYQQDCQRLQTLDSQLREGLTALHAGGLTKYQYSEDGETELTRIIDFSHQLEREKEALEKKARSAVVNVTACLRDLRDGLLSFKSRMREFNKLISHHQLSDLKVFKVEPEDDHGLVSAIELLISTAEQVESGDTFHIFNQSSVLDDADLDRARQVLVDEGQARHGLRVADLFHLRFILGKVDAEPEAFDDLDSAASHGTVMMAKLITGLAMLNLMQDKRHQVQAICYLDEALSLDPNNQRSLIEAAAEFGFALIFASPAPLITARYCVPIQHSQGKNHISRQSWQVLESLDEAIP